MTLRLILWGSILWLAPLVVGLMVNDAKFKKGIAVGVTLPREGQTDAEVLRLLGRFRREMWGTCIVLVLCGAGSMFLPTGFGASMTLWSVWLVLVCAVPYVPYARCNLALKRVKTARGWRKAPERRATVDLSAVPEYRALSAWEFLLPLAVSLIPLGWSGENWAVAACISGCIAGFGLIYRCAYRRKSERVDENAKLTRALTQMRLHGWGTLWRVSAWMLAAMNWVYLLLWKTAMVCLLGVLALSAVHILMIVLLELRVRRLQQTMTACETVGEAVDEDDHWIFGQFYYNPDDRHLVVNARTGLNTTVNLARPAGRVWMGLAVVCLLGCLAVGPWLGAMEKRPVTEETVVAAYGQKEYGVPLAVVEEVELLDALPGDLVRMRGTEMEHLLRGKFYSHTYGNLQVCLDPDAPPFLRIRTAEETYLVAARDAAQTRAVFDEITE